MGKKGKITEKKKPPTRKQVRKQKRQQKKQIKHEFFSKKKKNVEKQSKQSVRKEKKPQEVELSDEEIPSDDEISSQGSNSNEKPKHPVENPMDRFIKASEKENKLIKEITSGSRKKRMQELKAENEKEDRLIKQLEKKLKIKKKNGEKSVPKCFDDGFDYVLELCLPDNIDKMYKAAKEAADSDSGDEDHPKRAKKRQKSDQQLNRLREKEKKYFDSDSELGSQDSEIEDEMMDEEMDELSDSESDDYEKSHKYVRAPHYSDESYDEEVTDQEFDEEDSMDDDEEKDEISEDIYGRKRDRDGNVLPEKGINGKYVPPQMRMLAASESSENPDKQEKVQRLRKQLKGWLNRLAEANLQKIAKDTEDLYMKNSRHDMNTTLSSLILESIITPVAAGERMVLEHCLFIAVLHANVGSEIGAHFLETLIKKFDSMLNRIESYDVENKELDNIVLFLCHLYTFQICQHNLIFEILNRVSAELSEKCVECILVILRAVGFALRKDDPAVLKDFIAEIRNKAENLPEAFKENARMTFMLDILMAVKNNNMLKIPNYDPTLAEHFRKVLKGILKNGKYVTSLNITIDDLLSSDQRGKWWIVGSAWTGRMSGSSEQGASAKDERQFSEEVVKLAHQHRMNTEVRKNVFCTVMTADDPDDTVSKLMELSIKDNRVIASILIYTSLLESPFNPYYAVVAEKLCYIDRKFRLAFQFAAWDKIKNLSTLAEPQIVNLSKFLSHLIEEGAQPLSILKVIDFGQIDTASMKLVRRIMLSILLKDDYTCKKVFSRIAPSANLNAFKDSIKLFLQHFLLKKLFKLDLPEEQLDVVRKRITIADEALSSHSRVLL
ncbi:Nucleolar MIF4G domain-containing protein 1 homolog [Sergentomyia squamirostris]